MSLSTEQISEIKKLTLRKSPLKTLYYFSLLVIENLKYYGLYLSKHPGVTFFLVPILILYLLLSFIPGGHLIWLKEFEEIILFITWWLVLGILSSIGLGTGMHTGLLFLFPHIMKVCWAASECKNMNFPSLNDMWLRRDPNLFVCINPATEGSATFFDIFKRVIVPCIIWGTGTAIGEIPPYAISRAARESGVANREFLDIQETKSSIPMLDHMKVWMINFLQKHGFIGVILMAAWPNAAFDLCGICCGHFLMPFWKFFLATFIGKAVFKVTGQACFFIILFTEEYVAAVVSWVEHIIPETLDPCIVFKNQPCYIFLEHMLFSVRKKFYENTSSPQESTSWFGTLWNGFILLLILFFVLSCIEQFAQAQATRMHIQKLEIIKESDKKKLE